MKFRFKADVLLEAEDIDDAFSVLVAHFKSLQDNGNENYLLSGDLDISPVEE